MERTVVMIREGKETRVSRVNQRADGTLWREGKAPLLNSTGCALAREELVRRVTAGQWAEIPATAYARIGDNPGGLRVLWAEDYDAEKAAEYRAANPGAMERAEIEALYARADRGVDDDYAASLVLRRQADDRLAAWRARYPAEARAEEARRLRSRADEAEDHAETALTWDADGSLDAAARQGRAAEYRARAAEYRRQAAELQGAR